MNDFLIYLGIFSLSDLAHLTALTLLLFTVSAWCARSSAKRLLIWLYSYLAVVCLSFQLEWYVLFNLTTSAWPVVVLAIILVRQKNLIGASADRQVHLATRIENENWVQLVLRLLYRTTQEGRQLTVIVEGPLVVTPYLETQFQFHAPLSMALIELLLEGNQIKHKSILLIRHDGHLIGFNGQLRVEFQDHLSLVADKLDALTLQLDPHTRLFSLHCANKTVHQLSAEQAHRSVELFVNTLQTVRHEQSVNQQIFK